MFGRFIQLIAHGAFVLGFFAGITSAAEDFAGKYEGDKLWVEVVADHGNYSGQIHLGEQQFPFKAHVNSGRLQGAFTTGGDSFDFAASRQGESLTLITGGTTYALKRAPSGGNPLDPHPPVNPLAHQENTGPAAGDAPSGYTVVTATDAGKALAAAKPGAKSVRSALESTLPDLARYFDGKAAIGGAFEDARDHQSGGASFTARLKGQPVKGLISCKLGEKGASIAIIYCRANASPADWNKLTSATGPSTPGATADIKLEEYKFPDGTGSVGLAEGWKTNAASCLQGVMIQGPADQNVSIGLSASVVTPDSVIVQTQRQLEANARANGFAPPVPLQLFVAPYTGPAEALANLVPQISRFSERNGGPTVRLDKILEQQKTDSNLPGGNAAVLSYALTKIMKGTPKRYQAAAQIETAPLGPGSWMFYAIELAGPQETFDRDLPAMMAMAKSFRTNDEVVQARTRENINAQNQRFATLQQAHREQVDSFDRANKAWERRQTIQSRSNADFDEVIRGYRTVEDTRTGQHTSVNLGNVHEVVNHLNEAEPDRYKEIPLRDETAPLPPDSNR